MAAAQHIDEDLRWLLEGRSRSRGGGCGGEADMPEPLSQHVSVEDGEVFVVPDPFWRIDLQAFEGEFVLHTKAFDGDTAGVPSANLIE